SSSRTPITHVQAAPQRNQKSARGRSCGTTVFLPGPSSVPSKAPLTKLKKYRSPIHKIPATTWIQRNNASRTCAMSITRLLLSVLGPIGPPINPDGGSSIAAVASRRRSEGHAGRGRCLRLHGHLGLPGAEPLVPDADDVVSRRDTLQLHPAVGIADPEERVVD